ncbi:MAG TPA: hypothetical protein VG206_02925 [Terriglobia bacterium]|nr:hypothetical protein [Terriglobia bacterium]
MATTHEAQIMEVKQLSDGMVAFRARCCEDSSTDSWHTVNTVRSAASGLQALVEVDYDAEVSGHLARVSSQHEATLAGMQALQKHLSPAPQSPAPVHQAGV